MPTRRMMMQAALSMGGMAITSACSSSGPEPSALQSSSQLKPDAAIRGAWIYRAPQANYSKYRRVAIDNVVVYGGAEASFGDMSQADRAAYAQIVGTEFRKVVGEKYQVASAPAPDVMRIHTTLIGVQTTVGGVATLTRVVPMGIAINAVRGVAGSGGVMTGGIELSVEFHDSQSDDLLAAAVRQISPAAFDMSATLSTNRTVQAAAHDAAVQLREALDRNFVA